MRRPLKEHNWAAYIDWGLPNTAHYKKHTKECAEYPGRIEHGNPPGVECPGKLLS